MGQVHVLCQLKKSKAAKLSNATNRSRQTTAEGEQLIKSEDTCTRQTLREKDQQADVGLRKPGDPVSSQAEESSSPELRLVRR